MLYKYANKAKIFAKLVLGGQINSALRYLSVGNSGGVLPVTDDVMNQLMDKHPSAQEARLGSLLYGPIEDVPHVLFQQINGEMVREATIKTKGSAGLSGVDANGFRRIFACKSFKASGTSYREAIAVLTKKLCTEIIDPATIQPILG